ncbi:GNAT family N-acetyltransferase [Atopobacter phocae]|uniref:GNAT family N-acetyltransferase n=1 Tax=Atopobacter phocae TaxID=136492 RepID=UPI000471A296|nr:GNAT family N-acetyltransferase [Atopobacter phocae]
MTQTFTFRPMQEADGPAVIQLLWIIFLDMELPLLQELPHSAIQQLMLQSMQDDTYRYSPKRGVVVEQDGQIAGAVFSYPGDEEPLIDQAFNQLAQATYQHPFVMFNDLETQPGEYYVDALVVHPDFRGAGLGQQLLMQAKTAAVQSGYRRLDLNCDVNNPKARALYERLGFQPTEQRQLSGHWYDLMTFTF